MKKTMLYPRKRSKKQLVLSLLLATVLIFTGAFAFLTTSETSTNLFTVGNVDVELTEPNWAPDTDSDGDGVKDTMSNILSGQVITKDPTIKNMGINDAYVYVMIEVPKAYKTNIVIDGVETEVTHHELFSYVANKGWSLIDSKVDDNEAYNYYVFAYENALGKGEAVTVFDEIAFANISSEYAKSLIDSESNSLNVKITGYAIQSDFYDNEASTPETAWELYVNQNGWTWPEHPYENIGITKYYSKISLAVNDVNNDEIGVNADTDFENAVASVYTEGNNIPTVTLLKDTSESTTILLGKDMVLDLGNYGVSFENTKMAFNTVADSGNKITVTGDENSSVSLVGTEDTPARAFQIKQGNELYVSGITVNVKSDTSFAQGFTCVEGTGSYLKVEGCSIYTDSSNSSSRGIYISANSKLVAIDTFAQADSPYRDPDVYDDGSYGCAGISTTIGSTAIIKNCHIKGLNAGMTLMGVSYIDGGTYEGWGHGGAYFSCANNTSYVKNATFKQCGYYGNYSNELSGGCNMTGFYIGGGSEYSNITLYMDNCNIYGISRPFSLSGSHGETNNSFYISNSTINKDYAQGIRIDSTANNLYIGQGCNFTADDAYMNPSAITLTDDVYTFNMPE